MANAGLNSVSKPEPGVKPDAIWESKIESILQECRLSVGRARGSERQTYNCLVRESFQTVITLDHICAAS